LRLILSWDGQRIVAAEVHSERPLAARVLVGEPADRAVALVPRLFSLCGQAQGVAAHLALQAARGELPSAEALRAGGRAVALEAIGEHLWRLLLDWPPLLVGVARQDEFVGWRKRLRTVADQAAATVLGVELLAWLEREALPSADPMPLAAGALLPWQGAAAWAREVIDDAFALRPQFAGQPAETGALARRMNDPCVAALLAAGDRVAARLAARYADLRFLARTLIEPDLLAGWLDAAPVAERVGLARVETARGLLLHLIQINDGRVGRYVIVAPTEWNFHPQGAFAREITVCPAPSRAQAERSARRLALALDPCVAYEVVVKDA
jgi:uptake hydrogenase large subunit